ncbi:hypothetical protein ACF9IK_26675 [Kitasatospora hibisci]|uniref:hypothetical protein n=1 Tax=Kitasatospora hibisci TaxID=3369522 RepID=UPI00375509E8
MTPDRPAHTVVVLGEDLTGWRTALLAALVAAVVLELATAVVRKALLRVPGLLLTALVRPQLTRATRLRLLPDWRAELSKRLAEGPGRHRRYGALLFVLGLACGGARRRATALGPERRRRGRTG